MNQNIKITLKSQQETTQLKSEDKVTTDSSPEDTQVTDARVKTLHIVCHELIVN